MTSALARSSAKTTIVERVAASTSSSSTSRCGGGSRLSEAMNTRSRTHPTTVVFATPNGTPAAASHSGEEPYPLYKTSHGSNETTSIPSREHSQTASQPLMSRNGNWNGTIPQDCKMPS